MLEFLIQIDADSIDFMLLHWDAAIMMTFWDSGVFGTEIDDNAADSAA